MISLSAATMQPRRWQAKEASWVSKVSRGEIILCRPRRGIAHRLLLLMPVTGPAVAVTLLNYGTTVPDHARCAESRDGRPEAGIR
jgi:hypothetical protein